MRKEFTYFATALMFFTRIPIPFTLEYSDEIMNKSQKYFPMVGWIVGGFSALLFWLAQHVFSIEISIVLSMIGSVLLTGAFHEDGFTDSCDAFGGGYGKEKIMTIMKDSRIGAYGVIGIILLLLLKFLTLSTISNQSIEMVLIAIVAAHTSSRFMAGTMIYTHQYVTDIDKSKSKPLANKRLSYTSLFFSLCITLLPFILFQQWIFLWALPISYLGKLYLGWYFKKHLGGYTGDCLGAVQQVCEVLFYLAIILIWNYTS
jgi:adenosylcobinamide-GDP ribazoletransferase